MNIRTNINKVMFSIIIGVVLYSTTTPTNATTMCVTDDNNSIILDPRIAGTTYDKNETNKTWWVDFDYGRISGDARCTEVSGNNSTAYPQYNFENYPIGTTEADERYKYCWCRMTSPVRSAWVYYPANSSAAACATYCANRCGDYSQTKSSFRGALFGSAGV
jgi:hypothetical protein